MIVQDAAGMYWRCSGGANEGVVEGGGIWLRCWERAFEAAQALAGSFPEQDGCVDRDIARGEVDI